MSPQQQSPLGASQFYRSNVMELKSRIVKQIGQDRAQQYFGLLNGFLSRKLSKVEFDKFCVKIVGRDNLTLHNLLVRSILQNACLAKGPPSISRENGVSRSPSGVFVKKSSQVENALNSPQTVNPAPNIFSNGDALPPSPPKIRSGTQNRRIKERPSSEEAVHKENSDVSLHDLKRPLQPQQGVSVEQLAKRPRVDKASLHDLSSGHNKVVQAVSFEGQEHMARQSNEGSSRDPLQAPLCIPRFSKSIDGVRRSLISSVFTSTNSDSFSRNCDSGELCHTELLKNRMEKIAQSQGLEGVTLDCANLLNNGLDLYLKQLIRSSVEQVGARIDRETIKRSVSMQKPNIKPVNGVWVDSHIQSQSSARVSDSPSEFRNNLSVTMQDFKVAMELKPQQLGNDWPLLLEKIRFRSYEE